MESLERMAVTPDYAKKHGRQMGIKHFNAEVKIGLVQDARIDSFGDGYGEPYNPIRTVWGWKNGELVWSEVGYEFLRRDRDDRANVQERKSFG